MREQFMISSRRQVLAMSASALVLAPIIAHAGLRSGVALVEITNFDGAGTNVGAALAPKLVLSED